MVAFDKGELGFVGGDEAVDAGVVEVGEDDFVKAGVALRFIAEFDQLRYGQEVLAFGSANRSEM